MNQEGTKGGFKIVNGSYKTVQAARDSSSSGSSDNNIKGIKYLKGDILIVIIQIS